MPYSQYVAGREPPSITDRILAHAQTVPLALLSFAFGVLILVSLVTEMEISRSLMEAQAPMLIAIAAPLIAGPPAVLWGAVNPLLRLRPLSAMALERAGSIASSAGTTAFFAAVFFSGNTLAISTLLVTSAVSAAFALKAAALWLTEKRVKARLDADATGG